MLQGLAAEVASKQSSFELSLLLMHGNTHSINYEFLYARHPSVIPDGKRPIVAAAAARRTAAGRCWWRLCDIPPAGVYCPSAAAAGLHTPPLSAFGDKGGELSFSTAELHLRVGWPDALPRSRSKTEAEQ